MCTLQASQSLISDHHRQRYSIKSHVATLTYEACSIFNGHFREPVLGRRPMMIYKVVIGVKLHEQHDRLGDNSANIPYKLLYIT
jgi:hypothetical protein